ncbi:hypothetical protein E2C01_034187 [Portunus trituberculatus]|uniref:Uncharacterized protein n=1 Tax=Portunus trituberculatus TaxID=210409 RepID=A0A5B7F4X8_PORTR|nr:hypothetical protein [Portunus trituberculatus]
MSWSLQALGGSAGTLGRAMWCMDQLWCGETLCGKHSASVVVSGLDAAFKAAHVAYTAAESVHFLPVYCQETQRGILSSESPFLSYKSTSTKFTLKKDRPHLTQRDTQLLWAVARVASCVGRGLAGCDPHQALHHTRHTLGEPTRFLGLLT